MPDVVINLFEVHTDLVLLTVDQTKLNLVRDIGEDGEVGASPVIGGAQRVCGSWPHLHGLLIRTRNCHRHRC